MLLYFVVKSLCGCGADHVDYHYFGTHEEALEAVVELQEGQAKVIEVWRVRLPRRKDAILAALNESAGHEVEDYGDFEQLAGLVRNDCLDPCDCDGDGEGEGEPVDELH